MGIIVKESIKQSWVRLALAVVGAIATMFIYPRNSELYGILGYVVNTSVLLMPIVMIGLGQASIRFFSNHNDSIAKRTKFLGFLFRLMLLNTALLILVYFLFKDQLVQFSRNPDKDFSRYFAFAIPGAICFGLSQFLVQYLSNYRIVTSPIIWQNLYRFGMPLAFLLVYFNMLEIVESIYLVLGFLFFGATLLIYSSFKEKSKKDRVGLNEVDKPMDKSKFYNFYLWAFASSVGSIIAFKIDVFMIGAMLNFESTGDYLIAMFMTNVIAYPIQSVLSISTPMIAKSWQANDIKNISEIYLKGSENLLFIGAAILMAILIAIQCFAAVSPRWEDLKYIQIIVLILGVSKLFDMMSSVNGMIIQYSKWYRVNTYFILALTAVNVILNFVLIEKMGIVGAALATLISLSLFNIFKCVFLNYKIGTHPYSRASILFFILSVSILALIIFLDGKMTGFTSIGISTLVSGIFLFVSLYGLNFAPEVKNIIDKFTKKII